MTSVLETPRLVLQPLELADAAAVQLLFPHWEIVQYLAKVPWPYPEDGSLIYYRDFALPAVARGQEWHWTLRRKEKPDQVIGAICLATGETNRGFWLVPEWQRQGLMTEAVHAVTDYWFEVLGFPLMRILKAADNIASRRISEKSGMRVVGTEEREYVSGTLLTEIWEITAEEWRERHGIYNASAKSLEVRETEHNAPMFTASKLKKLP